VVIGVDASADVLMDASRRARKASRGTGSMNALFLVGDAREALKLLRGHVHELRIVLPWGSLLRPILDGEEAFALAVAGAL
jgi:hypothetical protein